MRGSISLLISSIVGVVGVLGVGETQRAVAAPVPEVASSTRFVDVTDGEVAFREEWIVGAGTEADPDVYVPIATPGPRRIVFTTDRGSLTFDTEPGGVYPFVIELDGRRVFARIDRATAAPPSLARGWAPTKAPGPVAIPMRVDGQGGIRISASINDSPPFEVAFDTGAKWNYVVPSRLPATLALAFDGSMLDVGSDGVSEVPTSAGNRLRIADMTWPDVEFATSPIGDTGAILGWSLFADKLVELDYDRKVMVIHDAVDTLPPGYRRLPMQTFSGSPFVETTITVGDRAFTDWFLFDTGFNGQVFIGNRLAVAHDLAPLARAGRSTFSSSAERPIAVADLRLTTVRLGDDVVEQVRASVNVGEPDPVPHDDILGFALVQRWNTVLDLQHGAIYLRRRIPHRRPGCTTCAVGGPAPAGAGATVVVWTMVVLVALRRRRRR